jgi:hypothetical protein
MTTRRNFIKYLMVSAAGGALLSRIDNAEGNLIEVMTPDFVPPNIVSMNVTTRYSLDKIFDIGKLEALVDPIPEHEVIFHCKEKESYTSHHFFGDNKRYCFHDKASLLEQRLGSKTVRIPMGDDLYLFIDLVVGVEPWRAP